MHCAKTPTPYAGMIDHGNPESNLAWVISQPCQMMAQKALLNIRIYSIFFLQKVCLLYLSLDMLEPRRGAAKPASENKIASGRGTLRLRSKGPATVEEEVRTKSRVLITQAMCHL